MPMNNKKKNGTSKIIHTEKVDTALGKEKISTAGRRKQTDG